MYVGRCGRFRALVLCIVVLGAGCASGGSEGGGATPTRTPPAILTKGGSVNDAEMRIDETVAENAVAAVGPPKAVWPSVLAVYEELELKPTSMDTEAFTIGVGGQTIRRQLGGERLSNYFDCGRSLTAPKADSYLVTVTVRTELRPMDESTTAVVSRASATARDLGTGTDRVACASTGRLEKRIGTAVSHRVLTGKAAAG